MKTFDHSLLNSSLVLNVNILGSDDYFEKRVGHIAQYRLMNDLQRVFSKPDSNVIVQYLVSRSLTLRRLWQKIIKHQNAV